jgi:hypothetical protein
MVHDATWMELEDIMLSEKKSQKNRYYMILLIWSIRTLKSKQTEVE